MPLKAYKSLCVYIYIYICTLSICVWHVRGKVACHFHLFAFWQRLVRCSGKARHQNIQYCSILQSAFFCEIWLE